MFATTFSRNSLKFLKEFTNSLFRAHSEQFQTTIKLKSQLQYSTVKFYDEKLTSSK